jgi:hypothetical protein
MTFDVFEVFIHMIVAAFLGSVLRVDRLDVSAGTDLPLTRRKGSIISSLSELTVGGIKPLTGVGAERMRCDAVWRRQSGGEVAG